MEMYLASVRTFLLALSFGPTVFIFFFFLLSLSFRAGAYYWELYNISGLREKNKAIFDLWITIKLLHLLSSGCRGRVDV